MKPINVLSIIIVAALLSACSESKIEDSAQLGPNPELPEAERGLLPTLKIADPAGWGDRRPIVPSGYNITAIATDLQIPRQTLVLPNGDILVAEGRGGNAAKLRPKDVIAGYFKSKGTTSVESGDRLTLLRDGDNDGTYETRNVFAENLNAPYGLALIGDQLYVANQDAVVQFDYQPGQTEASGPPRQLTALPSEVNHHWTKAMTASPDGRLLYVGIGSNSNIAENGLNVEENRAMIWEIDAKSGAHRPYATGLRNPTAMDVLPGTNQLWAVINERDELGPRLVPDYLTSVQDGAFYGWPYSYWGQHVDSRVKPQQPDMVAAAVAPDYSLGSHKAPLGLAFSTATMGGKFTEGAFIGEHGSWNRSDPAGYDVVFVPFSNGKPAGDPVDFVTGFQSEDGKTFGRPVGVTVDPKGALIVADDLSNTIWRVTPTQ
ncbi:sorbosone dehydrogenase family protein [uncultured Psychrobacter sp.]|uniref:PQQ-dependent sugar dehydrogenase n=1 Tax=uncultured Psychrobacter sp. TaxID=259303 RepID=UPI0034593D32